MAATGKRRFADARPDVAGDEVTQRIVEGGAQVYALARNGIVATGAYSTTEVLGFICTAPGTGDWTITFKGNSTPVSGIDPATFGAGGTYAIHATAITIGTGGEALLFIPDA